MRYYQEEDKKNILKLREVLKTLPEFLEAYFLALAINTAVRTRLSYARELRVFFEYIHTLPNFSDIDIEDISFKDNGIIIHRKGGNEYMVYFGDDVLGHKDVNTTVDTMQPLKRVIVKKYQLLSKLVN